jgi:ACR3 family arsenite efflux pump ArsB
MDRTWISTQASNLGSTLLLVGAIAFGALIGSIAPGVGDRSGNMVDYAVLSLVFLLFFEMRIEAVVRAWANTRFILLAWLTNFVVIPLIGYSIASIVLQGKPLFFTGLIIYFIAPCTDWFLGFTRMARGNMSLGAALLPINMVSQLLLYPFYLRIFTSEDITRRSGDLPGTLVEWFLVPFILAILLHQALRLAVPPARFETVRGAAGRVTPFVIATVVFLIFAANIGTIREHISTFAQILLAVFLFFVTTYVFGEAVSRLARLDYPEQALFTMTTAARNAPLMLGITAIALPDQPLIYAALVIGMLVEFPHLTVLKHVLLRRHGTVRAALGGNVDSQQPPSVRASTSFRDLRSVHLDP